MSVTDNAPEPVGRVRGILTDRLWQSLLGVMVVLLVTVAYLFSSVLETPLLGGTKVVQVEMTAAGGLFEGSSVTYRGVKIGKVREINLRGDGVVAIVRLTGSEPIPIDSVAKVRSLSPVGEQYLDFQPRTMKGPFLKDGSVVPATATDIPKTLASTVIALNKVLDQVDTDQLQTLLTELSTGLAGTGQQFGQLVDQGDQLLADLEMIWPETDRLITNAGTVLKIAPAKADEIRQLGVSARQFAAFLKDYDPELRGTLTRAPEQIRTLRALVKDASEVLPGFLGVSVEFSDLFRSYAPHLGAILTNYAPGIGVLGKAVRNGVLRITGIPQPSTRCRYATPRRDPRNPERRDLVVTGKCAPSAPNLQRGASQAPGPVE